MRFLFTIAIAFISCYPFYNCKKETDLLPEKKVVETYHGYQIEDPYRYLENLDDSLVQQWMKNQNQKAENYIDRIQNKNKLIELQQHIDAAQEQHISHIKVSNQNQYFYLKRQSNENVAKLFFRDSFDSLEQLLFDPKDYNSKTKDPYIINYIQPNWTGSKIAVSLTQKGKEISDLIIIDTATKKQLPDIISNVWPSNQGGISWLPDGSGFSYLQYFGTNPKSIEFSRDTKSYIHYIGKKNKTEIFSRAHNPNLGLTKEDFPYTYIQSQNTKYIIGYTPGAGSYYNAYYNSIQQPATDNWKLLFKKSDKIKSFEIINDSILFLTANKAPNYKLCKTSIIKPDFENPEVLIPTMTDKTITDFTVTSEGIFYVTSKNGVKAQLYSLSKNKKNKQIQLPENYGAIFLNSKGHQYPELWIEASGWTTNNKRYEYRDQTLSLKTLYNHEKNNFFNDIIVEEIEVPSHDGALIPLSIVYKKGTKKKGNNKLLLIGYGAYGISMSPRFSISRLLWVKEGGIFAIAHVRGGGEKGDFWHKQGHKTKKANTWKDFIACSEYLIYNKYTSSKNLAVWSGSAGGIMIGRAITERPELFGAAIIEFGSLNMLRSEMRSNGALNTKEFGSIDNPEEFKALLEMDAYYHIKKNTEYPPLLLTAGLNDPRVPAWFSGKFMAKMLASDTSKNEKLFLVDSKAGHGIDNTKTQEFERYAHILAFAFNQTKHPNYQTSD